MGNCNSRGGMSNNWGNHTGSMDSRSVGNQRSSMHSMGKRSSMGNRSSMSNRSSMNQRGSMGNGGSMDNRSLRVDSLAFIGDLSNIAVVLISLVVDMLSSSIRESNRVGSRDGAGTIRGLSSIEGSSRVVVSNSILIGVGRGHVIDLRSMMDDRGMGNQGSGMGNNRGSMNSMGQRSSMHSMSHWSSMHSVSKWSSMGQHWGSMDSMGKRSSMNSMSHRSMDSMSTEERGVNSMGSSIVNKSTMGGCHLS